MYRKRSGQTSMILLVLVVIIFAALVIFLLSLAETVSPKEYMNTYTQSLLLSLLRSDTGSHDPECKYLSDAVSCAFFQPSSYQCAGLDMTCRELVETRIDYYMSRYAERQGNLRYRLSVTSSGFLSRGDDGEVYVIEFGDPGLATEKVQKWSANQLIQRVSGLSEYYLTVNLQISVE